MTHKDEYGFRFREWDIYNDARKFRKKINELLKKFPKEEKYALTDQTKRALSSIILNIAEGSNEPDRTASGVVSGRVLVPRGSAPPTHFTIPRHSSSPQSGEVFRRGWNKNSDKDTRVYINRAQGSLDEVVACLDGALDDNYITLDEHKLSLEEAAKLAKQLKGFNSYLSNNLNRGQRLEIRDERLGIGQGLEIRDERSGIGQGSEIKDQGFKSGFTLFELIIYITILAIIGTVGATVLDYSLSTKAKVSRLSEVNLNLERAMLQMVDRVHTSQSITDASSTLILKMADASKDPTVFALSSGTATIQEGSGSAIAITPPTVTVISLQFTKITNTNPATSSVRIIISAGYNDNGAIDQNTRYTLQTTAAAQ